MQYQLPANTPTEALSRYKKFLQRTLGCLSRDAQWTVAPALGGQSNRLSLLHRPDVLRLRRTVGHDLYLVASQAFVTVPHPSRMGEYKVKTLAYSYVLAADEDIHQEFLTWQWHPDSTYKLPHAHICWPCAYWYKDVSKLHLPTGRVSLELLAGFLFESLDVRAAREDWRNVLDDSRTRFETYRSWA